MNRGGNIKSAAFWPVVSEMIWCMSVGQYYISIGFISLKGNNKDMRRVEVINYIHRPTKAGR